MEAAASPEDAAAAAAEGERVLANSDVCQQCSMSFRVAAARAFTVVGDLPNARRHLDEAVRVSAMWQGGPWPGAVSDAQADVEAAAARREEA